MRIRYQPIRPKLATPLNELRKLLAENHEARTLPAKKPGCLKPKLPNDSCNVINRSAMD